MVFSSVIFVLVFLPLVLGIYKILSFLAPFYSRGTMVTRLFLFIASIIFYLWGEPRLVIVLLASTIGNYIFGRLLGKQGLKKSTEKTILAIGVILNLALLGGYKYLNFLTENAAWLMGKISPTHDYSSWITDIALPLGISFYTFQGLSYLIDIYRKHISADKSFVEFACYLTMFPQLVAGPIIRYADIENELHELRQSPDKFMEGASRFTMGLAKKLFIADAVGSVADAAFGGAAGDLSAGSAWIGILCYTLQIYYDFSAYSDMAIGLGKMLGFTFPENFNYPYISRSLTEFWKRWHISLSSWLRDYLYIPLGGNRKGHNRTYINLFIVFILCGLWHGASWVFIIWGLFHGCILVLERIFPSIPGKFPRVVQHVYTIFLFMMGWVVFRADTAMHAFEYYNVLFSGGVDGITSGKVMLLFHSGDVYLALLLGILFSAPLVTRLKNKWNACLEKRSSTGIALMESLRFSGVILIFIACLLPLFGATYNAFIYFRF